MGYGRSGGERLKGGGGMSSSGITLSFSSLLDLSPFSLFFIHHRVSLWRASKDVNKLNLKYNIICKN